MNDEMYSPVPSETFRARHLADIASWSIFGCLFAALLAGALIHDRAGWHAQVAGEATTIMMAESLVFDFDLTYERVDHDRFAARWHGAPSDLDLVSGSDGRRIAFDRPFPQALALAPFLAALPRNGFAVFNVLLLAAASLLAARVAARTVPGAPILVSVLVFGSVVFAHTFFARGDVFLIAVLVAAISLVVDRPPGTTRNWIAAGGLLAIAAATDPLLALLPIALFFAAGRDRRTLALGFASGCGVLILVRLLYGGGIIAGFDAIGFRFTPATGFPLVDFSAEDWPAEILQLRAFHRPSPPLAWGMDLGLLWANLRYLIAGRTLGLLPYFLPLILLPLYAGRDLIRRSVLVAAGLFLLATLILRPFDLADAGGPGALANRAFIPVYGALWLVFSRPRHGGLAVVAALLAAPFLLPVWLSPGAEPADRSGALRHVSPAAARWLPYETSQRHLASAPFSEHRALWVRPLRDSVWVEEQKGRLAVDGSARGELLVASAIQLATLRLDFAADAPSAIEVDSLEIKERLLDPGGGISFRLSADAAARHPLWWTAERMWLYRLTFQMPSAAPGAHIFRITGERWVGGTDVDTSAP